MSVAISGNREGSEVFSFGDEGDFDAPVFLLLWLEGDGERVRGRAELSGVFSELLISGCVH